MEGDDGCEDVLDRRGTGRLSWGDEMSDEGTDRSVSRRRVLRSGLSVSGVAMLAGCSVSTGDDGITVSFDADGAATVPEEGGDDGTDGDGGTDGGGGDDGGDGEDGTDDAESFPEPPFDEDCMGVDPTNLDIEQLDTGRWAVIDE